MLFHPVLLFFDVSGGELLVIVLVVFLVFGPQKMPEIARKLGRAMNQVKKASSDLTREFREETSGIRSEIMSAQNQVRDEIASANQEIHKTRARVISNLSVKDEPVDPNSGSAVENKPEPESKPGPSIPPEATDIKG
jgi:TatA/E family protein of Tat protein translocase